MTASQKSSHVTQYKRPWWKGLSNWWPLLIFIAIAVFAVVLYSHGGKYRVLTGTAERMIETIAPIESARIQSIHAKVGDVVKAGDIIAQLDTSIIDAESAVLKEKIIQSRLEAQLDQLTLERQFATALQDAQKELRMAEMEAKIDLVEHQAVLEEIARLEPLLSQQLIDSGDLVASKSREIVLREKLRLSPEHINALKAEVERAEQQQTIALARLKMMNKFVSSTTEDNEEAVTLLNVHRDGYTLRARQDGVIAEIERGAGDVVEPGGAIATLLIDGPTQIVGFVPESNLSSITIGTPARIYPSVSIRNTGIIPAHVIQISPAVYSLPERASPIRGQVVRGRRITLALDADVRLVPGESVSIEMESSLFAPNSLDN